MRSDWRVEGLLLLDKPKGLSSQQCLSQLKRSFWIPKLGHAGTLDPLATGLLPCAFGEATKFLTFFHAENKSYQVEVELGYETDTLDQEGAKVQCASESQIQSLKDSWIRQVLLTFQGEMLQIPPRYSALKFQGSPRYNYARRGLEVPEPEARRVQIFSIRDFQRKAANCICFEVSCSTGTYIRSLARDLGRKLGVGATLNALRRTQCGGFSIESAYPLKELLRSQDLSTKLCPSDSLLESIEVAFFLSEEELRWLSQGQVVPLGEAGGRGLFPLLSKVYCKGSGLCHGVAQVVKPGFWRALRWRSFTASQA